MTETTETLFSTPQDALVFAFNYSMQQQGRTLVDRLAAPTARTGKGLSGNDGAAQAGIVRRELEELPPLQRAVLTARFAPRSSPCSCGGPCCSGHRPNREWTDAIRLLEQEAAKLLKGHKPSYLLRRRLVEKAVGVKVQINMLARECHVDEKTAAAQWKIVKAWLWGEPKKNGVTRLVRSTSGGVGSYAIAEGSVPNEAAVDGLESAARKAADGILSTLPFVGKN